MALLIGEHIPTFEVLDDTGKIFNSNDLKGKVAVIYFYPKNFTPGCTKEACSFRDQHHLFIEAGAKVLGVSSDTVASHQKFKEKYKLPFTFLADTDQKVRKLFGVKANLFGLLPGRETYIFDKEGKVRLKFNSMISNAHIKKALEIIKELEYEA